MYTLSANDIKDETDTAAQIKIVQQMLVEHVDAIVIAPADSKALVPVLAEAVSKGVIVVNIDNKLDADALKEKNLVVPFVGPDNRKGAKLAGDYLAKQLKSGDKVGILGDADFVAGLELLGEVVAGELRALAVVRADERHDQVLLLERVGVELVVDVDDDHALGHGFGQDRHQRLGVGRGDDDRVDVLDQHLLHDLDLRGGVGLV